jgi:hypothetical protein
MTSRSQFSTFVTCGDYQAIDRSPPCAFEGLEIVGSLSSQGFCRSPGFLFYLLPAKFELRPLVSRRCFHFILQSPFSSEYTIHKQMSLYSDDRRKRKWDAPDSSPGKSRSSGRDRDERDRSDRDRDSRHESSRYDDRHGGSSSSSHRERHSSDRRSASPQPSREPRKHSSRTSIDPAAAAGQSFFFFRIY